MDIYESKFRNFIPSSFFIKHYYYKFMGKKLNLHNPKTFQEKLNWLKLNYYVPIMSQVVDKYAVRSYVKDRIGKKYLIPLIGVYDKFDDIDFNELPNQFVLKCTHDSGSYIICEDKNKLDINAAKEKINYHMSKNYYYQWREKPYKKVNPKIIIFNLDPS